MFNRNDIEEILSSEEKCTVNSLSDTSTVFNHDLDDYLNGTNRERLCYLRAALVTNAVKNGVIQDVATAITVLQSGAVGNSYEVNCHPNKHLKKLRALLTLRVQHGLPIDDVVKAMEVIARSRKGLMEEIRWTFVGDPNKAYAAKPNKQIAVKVENNSRSAISFPMTLIILVGFGMFGFFCFSSGYHVGATPSKSPYLEKLIP